jgi:hypothetical protein
MKTKECLSPFNTPLKTIKLYKSLPPISTKINTFSNPWLLRKDQDIFDEFTCCHQEIPFWKILLSKIAQLLNVISAWGLWKVIVILILCIRPFIFFFRDNSN